MKRQYELYIMNSDLMTSYFGLEGKIFQLFNEMHHSDKQKRVIVEKQIQYITKEICFDELEYFLQLQNLYVSNENQILTFSFPETSGIGTVRKEDRFIRIEVDDSIETEAKFFEVLRHWNKNLFAVEFGIERYGWLSPIKRQKLA